MSPAVASLTSLGRFIESVEIQASDGQRPVEVERLPDGRTTLAFRALASGQRDLTVIGRGCAPCSRSRPEWPVS